VAIDRLGDFGARFNTNILAPGFVGCSSWLTGFDRCIVGGLVWGGFSTFGNHGNIARYYPVFGLFSVRRILKKDAPKRGWSQVSIA